MFIPSRFVAHKRATCTVLGIVLCGCASSPKERVVVVPEGKASQQDNSVREMFTPAKPTSTSASASPAKEGTSVPPDGSATQNKEISSAPSASSESDNKSATPESLRPQETASQLTPNDSSKDSEFTDHGVWSVDASSTRQSAHDADDGHLIDYAPQNAIDGRLDTAWSKGGSNHEDGIGEWLQVTFPVRTITRIGIVTGYPKHHPKWGDVFWINNRIKNARLKFSDGSEVVCSFRDEKEMQVLILPTPVKTTFVRIIIEGVYPSSNIRAGKSEKERWHDTLIAEVAFWGYQEP